MKYLVLTLKHKWFVFLAGLKVGCPIWRLIVHDWTKFLPSELPHYQRQFFGKADNPLGFITCWVRHQNRHGHHWEYWVPRTGHSRCIPPYEDNEPIPMPLWAIQEMVADWMGAGRAYEGKWPDMQMWPWVCQHIQSMRLHPKTLAYLQVILTWLGCGWTVINATIPELGKHSPSSNCPVPSPNCPACGVPFDQHPGLIPTCRALQEARK